MYPGMSLSAVEAKQTRLAWRRLGFMQLDNTTKRCSHAWRCRLPAGQTHFRPHSVPKSPHLPLPLQDLTEARALTCLVEKPGRSIGAGPEATALRTSILGQGRPQFRGTPGRRRLSKGRAEGSASSAWPVALCVPFSPHTHTPGRSSSCSFGCHSSTSHLGSCVAPSTWGKSRSLAEGPGQGSQASSVAGQAWAGPKNVQGGPHVGPLPKVSNRRSFVFCIQGKAGISQGDKSMMPGGADPEGPRLLQCWSW